MTANVSLAVGDCVIRQSLHGSLEVLRKVIHKAVIHASAKLGCPLKPLDVFFMDTKEPVPNWDDGRLVGARDIGVTAIKRKAVSHQETLAHVEERLKKVEASLAAAIEPRLRNLVAQILLHACGKEDFHPPSSSTYCVHLGTQHLGVVELASSMTKPATEVEGFPSPAVDVNALQVAQQADLVISRQNAAGHPCTLKALDQEVSDMRRCIAGVEAELHHTCPWECRFLDAYEHVKRAFPLQFPAA